MAAPRSYVETSTVTPGQTLIGCASFDPAGGRANWRVLRVTDFTNRDTPTGEDITATILPAPPNPHDLDPGPAATFDREEVGYGWPKLTFGIPATATPGLYALQFSEEADTGFASPSTAYFIVRPASPSASVLVCLPLATTCAYAGGDPGRQLNVYDSFEPGRLRRVSLDRPFDQFPFGDKRVYTIYLPFLVTTFLADNDIAADLCTSFDLHSDPTILDGYQLLILAGHDEYWSKEMRDRVEGFVQAGKNLAVFAANAAWWQVRFEDNGRTMVCYKTAVEDPLAGVDDARVTGNWASAPTVRPENALTGVSFRRGASSAGPGGYVVIATDPSFDVFAGTGLAVNDAFAQNLLDFETDSVEVDRTAWPPQLTYLDGTPSTFVLLGFADLFNSAGYRGSASLGYFTDVGTVFTSGTVEWALGLEPSGPYASANVKTITLNVINALTVPRTGPPATFTVGSAPPSTWQPVPNDATGPMAAVCGAITGQLIRMQPSGTSAQIRHPELLTAPHSFVNSAIPHVGDVRAMASDLNGRYVFAGLGPSILAPQAIKRRTTDPTDPAPWDDYTFPPLSAQGCVGLAAIHEVFVALDGGGERWLYWIPRDSAGPVVWTKIGRWPASHVALTGFDGKLFAATATGDLVCREASGADLAWTKIGSAPAQTFNLAAYYGRLFALTGTPANATLQWRSATATTAYKSPSLVFATSGGDATVAMLAGHGDVVFTGTTSPSIAFSIATRVNDGMVFFYRSDGSATLGRFSANGASTTVRTWTAGSFGVWTHIAYVNNGTNEHVLFYKTGGTLGIIGRFDPTTGVFAAEWQSAGFSSAWTKITAANSGYMVFYAGATGSWAIGTVATNGTFTTVASGSGFTLGWDAIVPAGQTFFFTYRNDGRGALVEYANGSVTTLKTWVEGQDGFVANASVTANSNGVVLLRRADGGAFSVGFSPTSAWTLRTFPAGTFPGTAAMVPIGLL